MGMYEASTSETPDSTVVLPPQIVFPECRYAAPSGTLALGDTVECTFTVKDSSGVVKPVDFEGFRVSINNWPSDENQEILGVLYLNFAISNKMPF